MPRELLGGVLLHALLAADVDAATIRVAFAAAGGEADPETWPWPTKVQFLTEMLAIEVGKPV